MPTFLSLALASLALPAFAQVPVATCIATEQCRGDAENMCAPSTLRIEVQRQGTSAVLRIDRQGPYKASLSSRGDARLATLESFGGAYQLMLRPDGSFTYLGNRGKRFSGQCEGTI